MTLADIDAVVLGKAPDLFEGVMMPELYLADALGAVGKPMFRVHTAGSVGGSTGIVGRLARRRRGMHKRVLAVAFEKQSEGNAQFALGSGKGASLGAGGAFAPFIRAYIHRSGAPEHIGWMVAVKDRLNALKNPYAHLKLEDISIEKVKAVPDAVGARSATSSRARRPTARARWCSPTRTAARPPRPTAARRRGSSAPPSRSRAADASRAATRCTRRRALDCADDVYKQAGITNPREQIDVAEIYVPFSLVRADVARGPRLRRRRARAGR